MEQLVIKILLIVAFIVLALFLLRPSGSARSQALRTITLLILLCAGILAVVFPQILSELAYSVGVGRGTDLLLYAVIIVFMGQALTATRKRRSQDEKITQLARQVALQAPIFPKGQHD